MKCDGCRACCSTLGVVELNKPAWTPCQHECAIGCNQYETRPETCRTFKCAYNDDALAKLLNITAKDRPDKNGLVVQAGVHEHFGTFLLIHLTHEGAAKAYWGDKLLRRLSAKHLCILVYKDANRKMIGPKHRMMAAFAFFDKLEKDIASGKAMRPEVDAALGACTVGS